MRTVALAGFVASLLMGSAAQAALVTYSFSGVGSGELGGTAFADEAFDILLVGDSDLAGDPYFTGQIFEISPLESARVAIAGFGDAVLTSSARVGINRMANVFYFGPVFGPDYLDLTVSDADETGFTFVQPYGPVGGSASTFGQFAGVATTGGSLTLTSVRDVSFSTGPALSAAPEPAAWALMILGFGGGGVMLRRRAGVQAPVS